jgi:hypothetical protein
MARIRIDNDSKEKLEKASELIDGTKSGLASEFIREKSEQIIDERETVPDRD